MLRKSILILLREDFISGRSIQARREIISLSGVPRHPHEFSNQNFSQTQLTECPHLSCHLWKYWRGIPVEIRVRQWNLTLIRKNIFIFTQETERCVQIRNGNLKLFNDSQSYKVGLCCDWKTWKSIRLIIADEFDVQHVYERSTETIPRFLGVTAAFLESLFMILAFSLGK